MRCDSAIFDRSHVQHSATADACHVIVHHSHEQASLHLGSLLFPACTVGCCPTLCRPAHPYTTQPSLGPAANAIAALTCPPIGEGLTQAAHMSFEARPSFACSYAAVLASVCVAVPSRRTLRAGHRQPQRNWHLSPDISSTKRQRSHCRPRGKVRLRQLAAANSKTSGCTNVQLASADSKRPDTPARPLLKPLQRAGQARLLQARAQQLAAALRSLLHARIGRAPFACALRTACLQVTKPLL